MTSERSATRAFGLRIGVLQGGVLVEERVIAASEEVTVGSAPRATIVLPAGERVPTAFTLFRPSPRGPVLELGAGLTGRVSLDDRTPPVDVSEARAGRLTLCARSRGKLALGDTTFLFQVIEAPHATARPQLPPSVRGSLTQGLDWALIAIVGASLVAHTAFAIYLRAADYPRRPDIEDLPVRHAAIFMSQFPSLPKPEAPQARVDPNGPNPHVAHASPTTHAPRRPAPVAAATDAAHEQAARRAALETDVHRAVANLLTSRGEAGEKTALRDLLRAGAPPTDTDEVFRRVSHTTVADARSGLELRGAHDGPAPIHGGPMRVHGPGDVSSGAERDERQAEYRGEVHGGRAVLDDLAPACDGEKAIAAVRQHLGALEVCYERELKYGGELGGKLQVRFAVDRSGRVTSASVEEDTVGSDALSACVVGTVSRWYLPGLACEHAEFSYPFLFQTASRR